MNRNALKCYLFKKEPLSANDYAEKLYQLLDRWRFRPAKFNEVEPVRNAWHDRDKFLSQFIHNSKQSFGLLITKWVKPSFFLNVTWSHGPRAKNHSLSIFDGKLKDFGGDGAPYLLDLADQLFETFDLDYGFACLTAEYYSVNIHLNFQIDENTIRPIHVVGMEWPDCIPGLYWCNYFGMAYFEQGFGQRIDECCHLHRLTNGVRVLRSPSALNWDTDEQRKESDRLMNLLGRDWFFTKSTGMPSKCLKTDKSLFTKRTQS